MNLRTLSSSIQVEAKPFIKDDVELPTSKSYANRLLMMAALDPREIVIRNLPESTDVLHFIDCLKQIGLDIVRVGSDLKVRNSFPDCELTGDEIVLKTGDGGTTNRFLASLLCLGRRRYTLSPSENMYRRPMKELMRVASELGVQVESSPERWLSLQGPIQTAVSALHVDCSETTQIATGFAIALAKKGVQVLPQNLVSSQSYWELTMKLLDEGKHSDVWTNPIDFSGASYPIALAAVTGRARFSQIKGPDPLQADGHLIEILDQAGVCCEYTEKGLQVSQSQELMGFEADCSKHPDLAPTLAYLASFATGNTWLHRTEVLKHKETDRLAEILSVLDLYSVKYQQVGDSLKIQGGISHISSVKYDSPPDHRLVMMVYLFMRSSGGGTINNAHYVKKSFPKFFEVMT